MELNVTFLNKPNKHEKIQSQYTQAKTLRGRKDTLAQVSFYWGAIAPLAPRDRSRVHFV